MDCRLQVFKHEVDNGNLTSNYRFVVVDYSKSKSYPANFVCILPVKINSRKGKIGSIYGELFREKSKDFAVGLLNNALKGENDLAVRAEIQRRLKLIAPKQITQEKCSGCKKYFQPHKVRRYKQNFCGDCLKTKYGSKP